MKYTTRSYIRENNISASLFRGRIFKFDRSWDRENTLAIRFKIMRRKHSCYRTTSRLLGVRNKKKMMVGMGKSPLTLLYRLT